VDKFDRIFHLHAILSSRRTAIALEDLMARLECSKSTLHRTVNALKDYLNAPVVYDTSAGGYRYAKDTRGEAYELPGLWFTPNELQALAVMQGLLKDIGGGFLQEHLGPIANRLNDLTKHQRLNLGEAASRLRFPALGARPSGDAFQTVVSATLQRRKLWIEYHARTNDERSERTISPQRVIHYRETWYLDAWDESRSALRTFSIDRIRRATVLEEVASDVPEAELNEHFVTAYGIFGGKADKIAVLRFTAERARWVADENWHPDQQGKRLADDSYELSIPYRDGRELVMDIMRHGSSVEVVSPPELREQLQKELEQALARYRSNL
jgi:proteasome accessory factor C